MEYRKSEKSLSLPATIPAFLPEGSRRYQFCEFALNSSVFIFIQKTHGVHKCPDLDGQGVHSVELLRCPFVSDVSEYRRTVVFDS